MSWVAESSTYQYISVKFQGFKDSEEIKKTFTGKLQEQMLFYGDIVVTAVMAVHADET